MQEIPGLDQLNDIVLPATPSLWLLATEAWFLIAIILYTLIVLVIQLRKKHQTNAYRLLGLELLKKAQTTYDISIILKRVALAAYPRDQVASLYGKDWQAFLEHSAQHGDYSSLINVSPIETATKQQKKLAANWIKKHRRFTTTENS